MAYNLRSMNSSRKMWLFLHLATFSFTSCEVYTSSANMEQIQQLEYSLLANLHQYVARDKNRLEHWDELMNKLNTSLRGVKKITGHPLNSYMMFKRFDTDWVKVEEMLDSDDKAGAGIKKLIEDAREGGLIPTKEDIQGAIDGLLRLQTMYKLESRSLAKGLLLEEQNTQNFSLKYIFEIGTHAHKAKEYHLSIQWFSVALEKLGNNVFVDGINKADVYDYLAANYYEIGDLKNALELTKKLAQLRPEDFRIQSNVQYLGDVLFDMHPGHDKDDLGSHSKMSGNIFKLKKKMEAEGYAKLCRGISRPVAKHQVRHFKCWYKRRNMLLYLKPQKVERLWMSPDILLFHDILKENESKAIKELAYPLLKRAKIFSSHTETGYHDSSRVSKNAWLDTTRHPIINSLRMRVQAVTNLDMNFSEDLQVANYGIGGHFIPHYDHAHGNHTNLSHTNLEKRIATLLLYLSHTKAGGRTVFTNAGVSIAPVKNSAVFWYNLKRNGKGDMQTKHAACPVLMGDKWVSNWWVHSDGQMLRRPCALKRNL